MIDQNEVLPDRARVSIAERLLPSLALGVSALTGVIGLWQIHQFFWVLRNAETAGYAAFFGGMAEIDIVLGAVLVLAALLGAVATVVSIIKMFVTSKTASPPAIALLGAAIPALLPPVIICYALKMTTDAVLHPSNGGISAVSDTVTMITYAATAVGIVAILILLAFAFVPFQARRGQKVSTLLVVMLVEIALVGLAVFYFLEMVAARNEMVNRG